MDVILSGVAGRDPLFRAEDISTSYGPRCASGYAADRSTGFRPLAEGSTAPSTGPAAPHRVALRRDASTVARPPRSPIIGTMAEIVGPRNTPATSPPTAAILASLPQGGCSDDRRMILKRVECCRTPRSSRSSATSAQGESWSPMRGITRRIRQIGDPDYRPSIHLDVYGTIGECSATTPPAIAHYLGELAARRAARAPRRSFVIAPSGRVNRAAPRLAAALRSRGTGSHHRREWCNTLDDIKLRDPQRRYAQIKPRSRRGHKRSRRCSTRGQGAWAAARRQRQRD